MPFDIGSVLGDTASGAASGGIAGGAIGLASGLIPQIVGLFTGSAQRKHAAQAQAQADGYFNQASDFANQGLGYAKQNLATAQNAYNGRAAGAAYQEANIAGNQGNTLAALGRNSTNSAQMLAAAGGVQGTSNNAYNQLGQSEAMNKMYQAQNLNMANYGVQGALGGIQNLNMMRGNELQQAANQNGQASQVNTQNALNGIGNLGIMAGMGFTGNNSGGGGSFGYNARPTGGIDLANLQTQGMTAQPNMALPGLGYNMFHQ